MSNPQFIDDNHLLLEDAYDVFRDHFKSQAGFLVEYARISDPLLKNRFLRLASIYKNLIKDGNFSVPPGSLQASFNYYDVTYKFTDYLTHLRFGGLELQRVST
jgi:hypothetical protein